MGKTKRIIAAVTAAIITATSTSLMSVCADNGEVKKSTLQETAEEINEYMRSNGISGYTYVQVNGGTENKLLIVYDGFLDKIQAYVTEKGIDYSLVEYRQSHDDSIVSDKSDEEKTPEKKYAETILEYMHSNSIQGGVSHSTDDKLLTVSYRGNYGEQLKAYIEELGLDENNIKYELEELPEFIAFNVTTVSQPTATTIAVTETKPVTTITMPVVDDPTMQTSVVTVTIMDISGDIVLVKPVDGSPELKSSSKFSLSAKQLPVDINPKVGMKLEITYNGGILETYPAQFGNVQKVTIVSETANDKEAQKPLISEDDILDLSKKGDELTWSDFEKYEFTDIGDGTNIWQFVIKNSGSKLLVIGRNLEEKPEHINCVWGNGAVFDIRTEDLTPWFYDDALVVKGDANCDGQVDLSDAVMIMQALANPDKYGIDGTAEHHLTEQGKFNGDMDGDGLTVGDAQAIQRKLLGLDSEISEIEPELGDIVSIKTPYRPAMSDWSGIGILLEFDSEDYSITLSTNEGHFTTWDKEEGSGIVINVGKTYDVGNKGYIFWTPDNLHYDEKFESEILVIGEKNGKSIEVGKIVINMNDKHTLSAVLK